jgi:hypothetical protein
MSCPEFKPDVKNRDSYLCEYPYWKLKQGAPLSCSVVGRSGRAHRTDEYYCNPETGMWRQKKGADPRKVAAAMYGYGHGVASPVSTPTVPMARMAVPKVPTLYSSAGYKLFVEEISKANAGKGYTIDDINASWNSLGSEQSTWEAAAKSEGYTSSAPVSVAVAASVVEKPRSKCNGYILWCKDYRQSHMAEFKGMRMKDQINKLCSTLWKALPKEEREMWSAIAKESNCALSSKPAKKVQRRQQPVQRRQQPQPRPRIESLAETWGEEIYPQPPEFQAPPPPLGNAPQPPLRTAPQLPM